MAGESKDIIVKLPKTGNASLTIREYHAYRALVQLSAKMQHDYELINQQIENTLQELYPFYVDGHTDYALLKLAEACVMADEQRALQYLQREGIVDA